jgi:hypothetical protein
LLFNPLATTAAHPDWENLYLAHGDGADGEQAADATRHGNPQNLGVLGGKILRINVADPDGAGPLRYGVPADNPFVGTGGARGEVWAYGFRNPHRFSWDIDPATPTVAKLFVNDIGFHDAEEVNIVVAGGNYGWAEREGLRSSTTPISTTTQALPGNDATFGYTYPVVSYPHSDANNFEFGDAISSGYVYRGAAIPALRGKYVFGDITTARLFYANLSDLNAVNDGDPATVAAIGVIDLRWDDPDDSLGAGLLHFDYAGAFAGVFSGGFGAVPEDRGLFTVIVDAYRARGGTSVSQLPGSAASTDVGRADVRWAMDASGELFLLSKSDGMIRKLVAAPTAWHVAHFTVEELAQASVSGDAADPDGDGVSNLLEYAFDLNPRVNSAALLPEAVSIDAGTKLRLEFDRLRSELSYVVEVSIDLVSWDDDVPDNPNLDVQTAGNHVTAVYTRGAQPRAFLRVNVVRAP